ncbi:MAG: phenylacetate--CoA ligase [Actinomycetia bacterium]|nr:phenylacetate--CoA ligase [Actinomycetes bacterium]
MSRKDLEALQRERLQDTLDRVYHRVRPYRDKFDEAGFRPEMVHSPEDLHKAPFTVKDDLRAAYPYGMFASPMREVVRLHASSGTTGQVTVVGYTRADIERWSDLAARAIVAAGGTPDDVVQVAYGYGLFTGGLGLHYGCERLGAAVVPISGGNTHRQVQVMRDFQVTGLACTPSYALLIGETALEMGMDVREFPVRFGVLGAEPWSDNMRTQVEQILGITALDIYGLSEVMGPGVAFECECKNGLHVNEDHFIVEIVDPDTLEPLPDGESGEVVITTITKEAAPLVRYRTRDISRIVPGTCPCGRTSRRIERIGGRTDDMIIVRGVNVFPRQIEQVLVGIVGVAPHYQVVLTKRGAMDHAEVHVEIGPEVPFDEVKALENLRRTVAAEIASALAVSIDVKLVEPKSIQRSEGKARRVIDLRSEGGVQ